MAGLYCCDDAPKSEFCGLLSIFEYINDDGTLWRTNCGQAAAATFLTHYGEFTAQVDEASKIMQALEKEYPPDNFFGLLGTSRRQVERICRSHGKAVRAIKGREALCTNLKQGHPVIVMLGVSGGRFWKWDLPAGHWMVACGFDSQHVYLTNWGKMTWDEFEVGWTKKMVPRLISMHGTGLVLRSGVI